LPVMVSDTLKLDVALIHYPVCNKQGEIIGSAVTNLDVHDIGRAGRTFGVSNFYIVTPYADQRDLIQEILDHWLTGYGSTRNIDRKEALAIVEICEDLQALHDKVNHKWGKPPVVLATCAKERDDTLGYDEAKEQLLAGEPHLLIFGTAWGLAPEVFEKVDATLPPIVGAGDYNHLSVRSAVSIVLDRLVGQ
jgi:hypothetical protein